MNHPIHPILVHFPIALLFTSVFFDLIAMITKRDSFRQSGFWLLILGWISGLAATVSGFLSEDAVKKIGVPETAIDRHETFAIATMIVFALLLLVRLVGKFSPASRKNLVYTIGTFIGLALLSIAGYLGGDLVYHYGAGVEPHAPAVSTLPPTPSGG